ncbi:hypothetical protein MTR_5g059160 [Medicago truncatula]|uniref:RNase H type-1 domain-containing protein n=1 Tax=Medicago truncatula TaxID=3880 RepID=G7K8X2_MEDTR|nr:hypothetical protein MTR_5g059160 [Medicago truncatula]
MDGANKDSCVAGCGGLIRCLKGVLLRGFSKYSGKCNVFVAESWGVLERLQYEKRLGFNFMELHVDSLVVAVETKSLFDSAQQESLADYVYWAIRKALSPFGKVKPIKWIRSHGLLKHDITRAKGHDIIRSGLQVIQLITAGYLMRKQSNSAF